MENVTKASKRVSISNPQEVRAKLYRCKSLPPFEGDYRKWKNPRARYPNNNKRDICKVHETSHVKIRVKAGTSS